MTCGASIDCAWGCPGCPEKEDEGTTTTKVPEPLVPAQEVSTVVWRHWCGALNDYELDTYRADWEAPLFCSGCRFEIKRQHIDTDCEFFTLTPAGIPPELIG